MPTRISADPPNSQTAERFAAERATIDEAAIPLIWIRPSDHDPDRIPMIEAIALEPGDAPYVDAPVGAGRIRGLVLHKLMEQVLTGQLVDDVRGFAGRARELLAELVLDSEGDALPDANEIATTARHSLELPEFSARTAYARVAGLCAARGSPGHESARRADRENGRDLHEMRWRACRL